MSLKTKALNIFCLAEKYRCLIQTSISEATPLNCRKEQGLLFQIIPICSIK